MKNIIIIAILICSFSSNADLHLNAEENMIIDPGMYWAILARNELTELKNKYKKSKSKKVMQKLRMSATFGFKPAMQAISAIYQNGDYGFKKDLPMAFAWSVMVHGELNKSKNSQFNYLKDQMTKDDLKKSDLLVAELNVLFGKEATFSKFQKWYSVTTTTLDSRLPPGVNQFLNLSIRTASGKRISAFQLNSQLKQMYFQHESDYYNVIPSEIIPIED